MLNKVWNYLCDLVQDGTTRLALGISGLVTSMGGLNWNMIFMVAGFLLGLATLLINWYYKHKNHKVFKQASKEAAKRGYILREPKE